MDAARAAEASDNAAEASSNNDGGGRGVWPAEGKAT